MQTNGAESAEQPSPPRRRFEELDVLRGIAAMAVVVFHYSGHATRYFTGFPFHFNLGEHGVQLFFGISGFVIFMTLEKTRRLSSFRASAVSILRTGPRWRFWRSRPCSPMKSFG